MAFPDDIPITGPLRLPLMFIDLCIVLVTLNVALINIKKSIMLKDTMKGTRIHSAWYSLFLGYAGMAFWYWLADYYVVSIDERLHLLQFGYFCAATGGFFFIYYVEQLAFVARYRIITVMFGVLFAMLIVLMGIGFVIDLGSLVQYFAISFWVPNLLLVVKYIYRINRSSVGVLKRWSVFVMIGFTMLILGILGATDILTRLLGIGIRIASDMLQILGAAMVAWCSSKLPSWKELEWKNAIESLYVIYKGGILAYEYDFGKEAADTGAGQASITVSVLEASRIIVNQSLDTGELKVIDFKNKKIYFEPGEYITVIMVVNEQLDTLDYLIGRIRREFEHAFASVLPTWGGDNEVFVNATGIISRILS
nr:hypothetical protein [Candidatus Sigynarchaeota archaeon]